MIVRLKFEDITASAIRGELNGKKVNPFMRVEVNELNIEEAFLKLKGNKLVAAYDFVGEPSFLKNIDLGENTVIVTREVEKLDMNVDFSMNELDSRIRVVFKLPNDYSDMRTINDYSNKYPNARYCGGKLIRLEGCNIGCIGQADITKKVAESRIPIVSEGCACVFSNIHIDDLDTVEFYDNNKAVFKEKKEKAPSDKSKSKPKASSKPKKQLSSLFSLTGATGDTDNF